MNLVLNSYGVKLQRDNNMFLIVSSEANQSFPPDVIKSISVHKGASITSDAVIMAIQNNIEIFFINDMGKPEGRVWSVKYGSVSNIRKAQVNFLYSKEVVNWVKDLVITKIDRQAALLLGMQPNKEEEFRLHNIFKSAVNSMEDYKAKIDKTEGEFVSDIAASLRGWEGAASRRYFQALAELLPESFKFDKRDRMPAKDPFNAMLNYAYGMLYAKVEGALVKAGVDPYMGIFHRDEYNRPALVFDIIEYYRTWMDYVVLQLAKEEAIPIDAFETQEDTGAVLLLPLAKRILIQSVNDFLSEIVTMGRPMSRLSHIEADAHKLANIFLKHEENAVPR